MSDTEDTRDLIPDPSVHLAPSLEALADGIFGGVPVTDEHRDMFTRMTSDFVNKSTLLEAAGAATLLHELHRHIRAAATFEDVLFDPDYIAELARADPKAAWGAYTALISTLGKKHEICERIKKQIQSAEIKGGDPSKHLHFHVVTDASQVDVPKSLRDDAQKRRKIGKLMDDFRTVYIKEASLEAPSPPVSPPRLLDADELPPDMQVSDRDDEDVGD
jgi:hypothetical protein